MHTSGQFWYRRWFLCPALGVSHGTPVTSSITLPGYAHRVAASVKTVWRDEVAGKRVFSSLEVFKCAARDQALANVVG